MEFIREILPGAHLIKLRKFTDARGSFVKTYARTVFEAHGSEFDFKEEFYSVSEKDVIRGMHFQTPPHDHFKLVFCPTGSVLDVLVDLRKGLGFGKTVSIELNSKQPTALLIPRGIAHGFKALEENTLMVYKTSTEYSSDHDFGVLWNSFGFDWQSASPIVSERDQKHCPLAEYHSPF